MTHRSAAPAPLPSRVELISTIVHVVHVRLECPPPHAVDLLDDDERARAARFVFERDRRRFIASHASLRLTLGHFLNRPPRSLRYRQAAHGKPRLVEPPVDLRFNLSHAGEGALIAVTLGREVGVDIEEMRPVNVLELATRFFAAGETATLHALLEAERPPAFFRCWTRKEAFIKALGDGLSFPLDQFEVSLEPDETSPQLLRSSGREGDPAGRWRIVSLSADDGYTAALAAEAGDWDVAMWSL